MIYLFDLGEACQHASERKKEITALNVGEFAIAIALSTSPSLLFITIAASLVENPCRATKLLYDIIIIIRDEANFNSAI